MDQLTSYQTFLIEKKQASENTVSSYVRDISQYLQWLASEQIVSEEATQEDVDHYTKHLLSLGKTVSTVTRSLASLKSFYTFLQVEGVVETNPAKGLSGSCPRYLPARKWSFFWSSLIHGMQRAAVTRLCWSFSMQPVSVSVSLLASIWST